MGPHSTFIIAAYSVAAVVIGALIAWVMIDYAALKRTLASFEERGITRGSDGRKKSS